MIEFNTADGEMLTLMHDGVVVKGAPSGDAASLFIGGTHFALRASYEDVVGTMEHFVYGSDQVAEPLAPTEEAIAKVVAADAELRNADVHDDEGNVGHGAAAAAEHVEEAPGAGTEQQPA